MAYATSELTLGRATSPRPSAVVGAFRTVQGAISTYVGKHRIYVRTLTELQAYSRRDLLDLGIDPDALHAFSRKAAGL